VLRALSSKRAQVALALDAGFEVLDTWLLTSVDDVGAIPRDRYPIALRPDDPTRVRPRLKIKVVHSPEEATAFVSGLQQIRCPIVAQPFLRAPNLVVHGVRAVDGELLALEAFLVARKYRAVTLTIERTAFPPGIEAACRFFADRAQLAGPFHYELLLLDGGRRAAFLEVNVRLGGTTDKVTRLGFDEPLLMLRAFGLLAPEACEQRHVRAGFAVNRRMILEHMAMAALGRVNECDYPQVGRLRHLAMDVDALLRGSDSVLGLGDACGSRSMYAVDRLRRLVRLPRGRTLRAWR
jgi:hypothetical protein